MGGRLESQPPLGKGIGILVGHSHFGTSLDNFGVFPAELMSAIVVAETNLLPIRQRDEGP